MFLNISVAIIAYALGLTMCTFKGLPVKKISAFLPGCLRQYLEINRMLTRLSREWIFSAELDTPAKRRRATKQAICRCANVLQQPWQDLLASIDAASRLPAAADEAYRLKLLSDSTMPPATLSSLRRNQCPAVGAGRHGHSLLQQLVLTVIIRPGQSHMQSLFASLQSLMAQSCPSWEVWLVAEDTDVEAGVIAYLPPELTGQHIRFATNEEQVLQHCTGLLVHELAVGDCLHVDAVGELNEYLTTHADVEVIYTDHDHLDDGGERCQPVFKPDWNPDLLVGYDYIGAAVFLRVECLAQTVQVSECIKAGHISKILYHCKKHDANAEIRQNARVYCTTNYLAGRLHSHAKTEGALSTPGLIPGGTRWQYPLPKAVPKVSLIIPTRDALDILKPCVESILRKTNYPNYELIIVDNQSADPATLRWLGEQEKGERVKVIKYDHAFNYSAMNNVAVQQASGDIIGLVNNDVEVISPDWLDEMVMQAWRTEIGCVGAKLYYGDGRIQHAGVILGANCGTAHGHRYFARDAEGYCGRLKLVQNVSAVTGACLLLRRELFERVGGLEEEHLKIAYNDIDLCLKVREAGYRNLWTPYAELYHHESVSRGRDVSPEQRKRYEAEKAWMEQRWGEKLWRDPCYNPNLTAAREDLSLNMLHGL